MKRLLIQLGLRFESDAEEDEFYEVFIARKRLFVQGALAIGSFIIYIFFTWDLIIDPVAGQTTHKIRGLLTAPVVLVGSSLLFIPNIRNWIEPLEVILGVFVAMSLSVIYMLLDRGYDYGSVGHVIFLMFVFCLMPARSYTFAIIGLLTIVIFICVEAVAQNSKPGMPIVNALCVITAVVMGMVSVVQRELAARRQFRMKHELATASARVDELLLSQLNSRASKPLRILISYRRSDSDAISGRIRDRLVSHLGEASVFMDIDSIPVGRDFRGHIAIAV